MTPPNPTVAAARAGTLSTTRTVLVVDDEPAICELLVTLLELTRFNVLAACDGLDALRQLRVAAPRPAVILLDLMMPTMDGIEFRRCQQGDVRLRDIAVLHGGSIEAHSDGPGHGTTFRFRLPRPVNAGGVEGSGVA